jgi:hypothetical protein
MEEQAIVIPDWMFGPEMTLAAKVVAQVSFSILLYPHSSQHSSINFINLKRSNADYCYIFCT